MKSSRKLLTTALAATMLVGALSVSTPASAWHRWGWGPEWATGAMGGGGVQPGAMAAGDMADWA